MKTIKIPLGMVALPHIKIEGSRTPYCHGCAGNSDPLTEVEPFRSDPEALERVTHECGSLPDCNGVVFVMDTPEGHARYNAIRAVAILNGAEP